MKLIFVCSPFAGDTERNLEKARGYCRFVMAQGHQPLAPHLLYPQFMDDTDPEQRFLGLVFSQKLLVLCDEVWAFGGPSAGMTAEIAAAKNTEKPVLLFNDRCEEVSNVHSG